MKAYLVFLICVLFYYNTSHAQIGITIGINYNSSIFYKEQLNSVYDIDNIGEFHKVELSESNYKVAPVIGLSYTKKGFTTSINYMSLSETHFKSFKPSTTRTYSYSYESHRSLIKASIGLTRSVTRYLAISANLGLVTKLGKNQSERVNNLQSDDLLQSKFKYSSGLFYGVSNNVTTECKLLKNIVIGISLGIELLSWKPSNLEITSYKLNGIEGIEGFPTSSRYYYLRDICRSDEIIAGKRCLATVRFNYGYFTSILYLKYYIRR